MSEATDKMGEFIWKRLLILGDRRPIGSLVFGNQSGAVLNNPVRTPLDLLINPPQIFPQNPKADQLHPAQEQDGNDNRCETRRRFEANLGEEILEHTLAKRKYHSSQSEQ